MSGMRNKRKTITTRPPKAVAKKAPTASSTAAAVSDGQKPAKIRFFRKFDWMVAGVAFFFVFLGYLYTLAPDVTLEDSGELAVASYYAGVPHPPGYPVWTIYTWLFTVLVPVSNIAFRVALASAFAGACSCGLLALMVSRGSSLLIRSVSDFQGLEERTEKAISGVCAFAAGLLLGFNGFMWSQAVIVEVYTFSVLSFMGVLVCLMRWMHAPWDRKYLYWAFFLFGICINNHQSLVVAAIGLEIAIAVANPRLGRDLFLGNSVVFILGLLLKRNGVITAFDANPPLFVIYILIGIGSLGAFLWLCGKTREVLTQWKPALWMLLAFAAGLSFYLYMPISSATNPPMNWGYPRTWEGFLHAFTRGQYEQPNPMTSPISFAQQAWLYVKALGQEFNPIVSLAALAPLGFFARMQRREKAWLAGLAGIFFCLAFILMILLNPPPDRQSQELNRVFFLPSHALVGLWAGYGLSLIAALLATQYRQFRGRALLGGCAALGIALYLWASLDRVHPLDRFAAGYLVVCAGVFLAGLAACPAKAPLRLILIVFAALPLHSALTHWWENEKRGHLYGYWFGHDMFEPPFDLYPSMTKNAILFGGTDPGRFNPTYMIFCESFLPPSKKPRDPEFDRRDVYLITQNALADKTYLDYIRAHYFRSAQKDPPFFQEMLRSEKSKQLKRTNLLARLAAPLDWAMTAFGHSVEEARRAKRLYPEVEIYTPSNLDFHNALKEYEKELEQKRLLNQLKPGDGEGMVLVLAINSILAKLIFDKNPEREFYIEESFQMDWMFPHLTPFGIILKLNREPVKAITEEMMDRDREFWGRYMERLIGNWITTETTVEELANFARKVYLRGDLQNYPGDTKFLRESWAQKAFSKLRSAIGGVYAFRLSPQCPPELRPQTLEEERRLLEEAELAFRQAFALCPYSLEAVVRYANLLLTVGRVEDALLLTEVCFEFDPENAQLPNLHAQLNRQKQERETNIQLREELPQLESQYNQDPANFAILARLIASYLKLGRTNEALRLQEAVINDEGASAEVLLVVSSAYMQLGRYTDLEKALLRLVDQKPKDPAAWYDLAATQALLQKNSEALANLKQAVEMERQRPLPPESKSLLSRSQEDPRFNGIRWLPEYRQLITGQ